MYHRVDIDFKHIENKTAIVNKRGEYHYIGNKKTCSKVTQQPIGDDGKGYIATDKGNETKEKLHL